MAVPLMILVFSESMKCGFSMVHIYFAEVNRSRFAEEGNFILNREIRGKRESEPVWRQCLFEPEMLALLAALRAKVVNGFMARYPGWRLLGRLIRGYYRPSLRDFQWAHFRLRKTPASAELRRGVTAAKARGSVDLGGCRYVLGNSCNTARRG